MFCKKCGKEIREDFSFCIACGTEIEKENKIENSDIFEIEENTEWEDFKRKDILKDLENSEELSIEEENTEIEEMPEMIIEEDKNLDVGEDKHQENIFMKGSTVEEIISVILGATSMTLSLFLSIFTLPMSISGIVFAEYGKHKNGKTFSMGKTVNIISMFTAVLIFCLYLSSVTSVVSSFSKTLDNVPLDKYYQIEEVQKETTQINKSEQKEPEIQQQKESKKRKFTNIGYMEYEIPDTWTFNGIKDMSGTISNVFSKDNDTVFLAIKSMDITGVEFSKEMLEKEITTVYGNIANSGTFTTNNGLEWNFIRTVDYSNEDKTYFNNIYYSIVGENEGLLYFEVYVPNTSSEEEIMKDIDEILTSVKTFK